MLLESDPTAFPFHNEHFEEVPCAICGKGDARVLIRGTGPARILKCRNDGLIYMSPRPSSQPVRKFHTSFVRNDNLALFDDMRRKMLRREAEAVKNLKPLGKLLDIGCGTGTLFENFANGAWRLYGVDTAGLGVKIARERYKAQIFKGTLHEAHYPGSFFDAVTILDTLYYVLDPKAELVEINRILKDDGLLAVEIPGLRHTFLRHQGPLCWLLDRKWTSGFTDMLHLYYFSPVTLRLLLKSAGFRVLKMIPEQASLARRGWARALNEIQFLLARLLSKASRGQLSIAGKEFYLAVKDSRGS